MRKTLLLFLLIFLIWIIWMGEFSAFSIGVGLVAGVICVALGRKFIPRGQFGKVRFGRLILYPFILIGEIYFQGIGVMRTILTGKRVDILTVRSELQSDFLKAVLINSINVTPGSIALDMKGEEITVLVLSPRTVKSPEAAQKSVEAEVARLDKRLRRGERGLT